MSELNPLQYPGTGTTTTTTTTIAPTVCNCLLVRIDPNDITSSTGNTLYSDNAVFVDGF